MKFISDNIKQTVTLKDFTYNEIKQGARHHLILSGSNFARDDFLILQPASKAIENAQHKHVQENEIIVITTKETIPSKDNKLISIYGFVSLSAMQPISRLVEGVYKANVDLMESNLKMREQGMEFIA